MPEIESSKKPLNIQELKRIKQAKKEAKKKLHESLPQEPPLVVLKRSFVDMPDQEPLQEKLGEIRVMTFNVLAQGLIKRELFPHSGNVLKWKSRRKMIVDEIKLYDPDILTMQELDNFEQYYKGIFTDLDYKVKYTKFETKAHGCGIAYKKEKFNFIDFQAIDYDTDTTCAPSRLTGNIAQLVALQLTSNPKACFVVGNTHLYWKPSANYERLRQSIIFSNRLLEFKSKLSQAHKNEKWISLLFGDFNTSPNEPVYPMLTTNRLDHTQIDKLNKSISLRFEDDDETSSDAPIDSTEELLKKYTLCEWHSIYSDYHKVNPNKEEQGLCGEPKFTNYTVAHKGPLDYMFVEKPVSISVKRMLTIPNEEQLKPSLPNNHFGSDHLCLVTDIEF